MSAADLAYSNTKDALRQTTSHVVKPNVFGLTEDVGVVVWLPAQ
jgi:hypothetical protein